MPVKYCGKCKEFLSTTMFTRDSNAPDGLYPYCRECRSAYRRGLLTRVTRSKPPPPALTLDDILDEVKRLAGMVE